MYVRILAAVLFSALAVSYCGGQASPRLSKNPAATDTQLTGTAQRVAGSFAQVDLYVCATPTTPSPPLNCSQDPAPSTRQQSLPNLNGMPFSMDSSGTFTITLAKAFVPGTFVWIVEVVHPQNGGQTEPIILSSTPVVVRLSVINKASIALSGTDSASRDVGAKVTLNLIRGLQRDKWGQTLFLVGGTYDDKWKSKPLNANVTENYSGRLSELKLFPNSTATAWGPDAVAYRNNTQGIRVEQIYGLDIGHEFNLPSDTSLELVARPQAMLENLYSPGLSVTLGGINLGGDLDHKFGNGDGVELKVAGTPVFNMSRAWSAAGDFSLTYPLSKHWTFQFEVVDNYYEIAPKTFNKNYLEPTIGFTFK